MTDDELTKIMIRESMQIAWKEGVQRALSAMRINSKDTPEQRIQHILDNETCNYCNESTAVFRLLDEIKELKTNGHEQSRSGS